MTTHYNLLSDGFTRIFLLTLSLSLTACGGSDENSEKATVTTQQLPITVEAELDNVNEESVKENITDEVIVKEVIDMDSLVAAEDFDFINKENIVVTLNFEEYSDKRGYVSVYQNYRTIEDGKLFPMPNSRVLAGALTEGKFSNSFSNLDDTKTFLVELWFYDGTRPLQQEISITDNKLTW